MLRVLRDSYANTDNPGVEMIGKLSVSLGLHAVAAKIPPKLNRIQTPALINYKNKPYLIKDSDEKSILITDDKNDFIKLDNENILEKFVDDIEVVLIEKIKFDKNKKIWTFMVYASS